MSKLKTKLAGWFLNLAKKCDDEVIANEYIPISTQPIEMIMYDKLHVDRIHAQQMFSNEELRTYCKFGNVNEIIQRKLTESISRIIFENYKNDIKETSDFSDSFGESTIYSLDVYVCKPTKKETI